VDPASGRPTGAPRPVVVTTREESRGAWSPDGRRIAFNSDRGGDMSIWVHSLEDGSTRQLTHGPGGDYQPHWSPDGRRLVFFSARSGNADLWMVEVESSALTQLTTSPWLDINPFFSPDGRFVAFQSDRQGRMEVWVMDADGTNQRQLTDVGVLGHFLPWSRDGTSIYFRAVADGDMIPMRVDLAGGGPIPVTVRGGAHMSFSPDWSLIADVLGHRRLWISPVSGGDPYDVFEFEDPNLRIDYPVWSPDGRWILFDRWEPEGGDVWILEPR
jgi:TolB protein